MPDAPVPTTLPAVESLTRQYVFEPMSDSAVGAPASVKFAIAKTFVLAGHLPPSALVEAIDFSRVTELPADTFHAWILSAFKRALIERKRPICDAFAALNVRRKMLLQDRKTVSVVTVRVADGEMLS